MPLHNCLKSKQTFPAHVKRDLLFCGVNRTVEFRYTGWFVWLNETGATQTPGPDLASGPAGEELYDHRNDTTHFDVDDFEYINLASSAALAATKQELRELLIKTVAGWQK
jgi:hypothetical protein